MNHGFEPYVVVKLKCTFKTDEVFRCIDIVKCIGVEWNGYILTLVTGIDVARI